MMQEYEPRSNGAMTRKGAMYNDSNAFAGFFEAHSETDVSMAEYLESCRGDPMRYANPAERLSAAIGEPQKIDTARDPRLGCIFLNRTMRAYPAFAGVHGIEETIERFVGLFRHAAQGLEERKRILYLLENSLGLFDPETLGSFCVGAFLSAIPDSKSSPKADLFSPTAIFKLKIE
jgi:PrkA AAA domain